MLLKHVGKINPAMCSQTAHAKAMRLRIFCGITYIGRGEISRQAADAFSSPALHNTAAKQTYGRVSHTAR